MADNWVNFSNDGLLLTCCVCGTKVKLIKKGDSYSGSCPVCQNGLCFKNRGRRHSTIDLFKKTDKK